MPPAIRAPGRDHCRQGCGQAPRGARQCCCPRRRAGDGAGDAQGLPHSHDCLCRAVLPAEATSSVLQTAMHSPRRALSSLLGLTIALWPTVPLSAERGPGCPKPGSTEGAEELLWAQARPEENPSSPISIAENRILLFSCGSSLPGLHRHQRPGANGTACP